MARAGRRFVYGGANMSRVVKRPARPLAALASLAAAAAVAVSWGGAQMHGQVAGPPSPKNGDWVAYTSDIRGTKYSPLDQVTAANFNKLEVAWRFKTDNL